jgi:hypothetical protein
VRRLSNSFKDRINSWGRPPSNKTPTRPGTGGSSTAANGWGRETPSRPPSAEYLRPSGVYPPSPPAERPGSGYRYVTPATTGNTGRPVSYSGVSDQPNRYSYSETRPQPSPTPLRPPAGNIVRPVSSSGYGNSSSPSGRYSFDEPTRLPAAPVPASGRPSAAGNAVRIAATGAGIAAATNVAGGGARPAPPPKSGQRPQPARPAGTAASIAPSASTAASSQPSPSPKPNNPNTKLAAATTLGGATAALFTGLASIAHKAVDAAVAIKEKEDEADEAKERLEAAGELVSTFAGFFFPSHDDEDKAKKEVDIVDEVKRELEASAAVMHSIAQQRDAKAEIKNAGLLRHLAEVETAQQHQTTLKATLAAYVEQRIRAHPWERDGEGKAKESVKKVKLGLALHEQLIVVSSDRRVLEVLLDILAAEP